MNESLMVLGWFENLPKDEVPPRHIWWSGDLLDQWFEDVDKRRKKKSKRGSSSDEDSPSMGNQLVNREELIPR